MVVAPCHTTLSWVYKSGCWWESWALLAMAVESVPTCLAHSIWMAAWTSANLRGLFSCSNHIIGVNDSGSNSVMQYASIWLDRFSLLLLCCVWADLILARHLLGFSPTSTRKSHICHCNWAWWEPTEAEYWSFCLAQRPKLFAVLTQMDSADRSNWTSKEMDFRISAYACLDLCSWPCPQKLLHQSE